jgi:hypothetical protein
MSNRPNEVWVADPAPGGWICGVCLYPVESEPCEQHDGAALTDEQLERLTGESAPRILATGSRDWTDRDVIYQALVSAWDRTGRHPAAILVQGECHLGGADAIAADIWASWGLPVEGHPAGRDANGRILGPQRNARMVALGAVECLAFPLPSSRGTRNCMRLAREAGIVVRTFDPANEGRTLDCPVCGSGGFGDCVCPR